MAYRTTIRKLVDTFRLIDKNPEIIIRTGVWTDPHWTADQFRRWFRRCLNDKINASDPRYPRGRKANDPYQLELMRLRQYVGNRIIMDWVAPCLGPRIRKVMEHRLRKNCE